MSPQTVSDLVRRQPPLLHESDTIASAATAVRDSGFPALPVVDGRDRFTGVFGEREFMGALFPGYVKELSTAGFIPRSLESVLEKRRDCRNEPIGPHITREHVEVPVEFSDVQLAEVFLHHRVLIIPIVDDGRVTGVVTRSDFFAALVARLLDT